jgi:tellurite methyltransferase
MFAGQFFGPRDGWAGSDGMTFHDVGEVGKLLDGLEVCYLREWEREGRAASGPKRWHAFGILARQPS